MLFYEKDYNQEKFKSFLYELCTSQFRAIRKNKDKLHDYSIVSEEEFFTKIVPMSKHAFVASITKRPYRACNQNNIDTCYKSCKADVLTREIGSRVLSLMNK